MNDSWCLDIINIFTYAFINNSTFLPGVKFGFGQFHIRYGWLFSDDRLSVHVRDEFFGHDDGSVISLVSFANRNQHSGNRARGSVQRMYMNDLATFVFPVLDVQPSRLVIRAIAAA